MQTWNWLLYLYVHVIIIYWNKQSTFNICSNKGYLFVQIGSLTGIYSSIKVTQMLRQLLSLGVAIGNLCFDLNLSVGQPTSNFLHEYQINHMIFESENENEIL